MPAAITVNDISKVYRLGERREGSYRTLRESLARGASAMFRRPVWHRRTEAGRPREEPLLWALKDVGFTVQPGEALGVIGRNGSGKSTLLKLISRITAPTRGTIEIRGRVVSLLEVGTGFHPELTGRENIYLNGAIIGMTRREVARKFDQIVAFSEVAKFIDTPVKRYSSGMYVRLAFAVAAHTDPDILLIDEVLSVGDLAFQRKCLDHARRMLARNVTLLFVSHNMFAIKSLCERAICLSRGEVVMDGTPEEVTRLYDQEAQLDMPEWATKELGSDPTRCPICIESLELLDEAGTARGLFEHGQPMRIRLRYNARQPVRDPNFTIAFVRSDNVACCNYSTAMDAFDTGDVHGRGTIELLTPPIKLTAELYSVHVLVWDGAFQRMYCAQVGKSFQVKHDLLSTDFGVFHEAGRWRWYP